ncbi:hypothetical protein JYU34_013428 [Plutella xylostella]|uniref:Uncharacterized protein n=1 Tax=Plutella xylostella TaxID=51655 RepID=A0ABQ7Q9R5_PLUXY|nr:hypothetical protein JYU34_013428 [Plutella xylostella]
MESSAAHPLFIAPWASAIDLNYTLFCSNGPPQPSLVSISRPHSSTTLVGTRRPEASSSGPDRFARNLYCSIAEYAAFYRSDEHAELRC